MPLRLGIPLLGNDEPWNIDVAVDGADQVDPQLNLIKGGGGALLREKIVARAARQFIVIVDEAKERPQSGLAFSFTRGNPYLRLANHATTYREIWVGPAPRREQEGATIFNRQRPLYC